MFKWFGKKQEKKDDLTVTAPISGKLEKIEEVSDPAFAQKMLGDGFAIVPEEDKVTVYAPVSGKIEALPKTKHAIGIQTAQGVEVLIHIGIDTVNLNGKGFEVVVNQDDEVKQGQKLEVFDKNVITENKLDPTVIVVFTSGYEKEVKLNQDNGAAVKANDLLIG
ncbi:PTS glucose transporter subunit IIA [Lactobacillus helsingborgensis]|uniref:PTS sugar transporter subunit IIA n=1 Tax=Lactobacillus helsingborgensis TaxID=1218494 RepID=UPI0027411FA9|nr:PTS glucose transporter subunit IIA [Lactobacillus helsingborgensis]WLT00498.1 PTS glucose transporter subunit IIA [Lactobacillus helsingborgensis]